MQTGSPATTAFKEARDFLLRNRENYELAYEKFTWPALPQFNWALDWFDNYAVNNHRTALRVVSESGDVAISFSALSQRSSQVANFFSGLGLAKGDTVLLMLTNTIPLWEVMLGAMKLGLVIVPTSLQAAIADLEDRIERGSIKLVVTHTSESQKFDSLKGSFIKCAVGEPKSGWINFSKSQSAPTIFAPKAPTLSSDPLLLYFTSGTTTKPKLVLHTHYSYPVGHLSTMYWIGIREGDTHQNISSPGWAKHAWSSFFAPWNAGATILVHEAPRFSASRSLETLERCQVNTLCAPPTVWRMLILENLGKRPSALRELASAGEPLNAEVIEQVQTAWGLSIRDGYGQTETTAQVGNSPGQNIIAGSMGRPLPGYSVVLLDANGKEAESGEVALKLSPRPGGLMVGYQDDPKRTSEAMAGGYYRTGDEASRGLPQASGYFSFVGRGDDVFKSSDYRISPFELESTLIEHPLVAEAAIIPSPDPVRLFVPKAFVVLVAGTSPSSETAKIILQETNAKLAAYQRIRRIEFSELPKTISGKIRRVQLRELEQKRHREKLRGQNEFLLGEL